MGGPLEGRGDSPLNLIDPHPPVPWEGRRTFFSPSPGGDSFYVPPPWEETIDDGRSQVPTPLRGEVCVPQGGPLTMVDPNTGTVGLGGPPHHTHPALGIIEMPIS